MKVTKHTNDGHILFTVDAPESVVTPIGANVVLGEADSTTHYVSNGHFIEKPTKPDQHHVFNYKTKQWHDPRSVEQKKADRISKIQAARAAEYPAIGDQLDILWKALAVKPSNLPAEVVGMLAIIQAVKDKHPK